MIINEKFLERVVAVSLLILVVIFLSFTISNVLAAPQGSSITSSSSENASIQPADSHLAIGGSFTTLNLNVTSQTSSWKAYVGNVSGKLTLDNANSRTIYDWALSSVQGEVYVSRNGSLTFASILCANDANISAEQSMLNISGLSDDSINNTFFRKVHRSFVIGGVGTVVNSSCYAISTFVNDTAQTVSENASFQEILMSDGTNLIYVTLLENKRTGFDFFGHDFQIIVPDDPGSVTTRYYFYAELG